MSEKDELTNKYVVAIHIWEVSNPGLENENWDMLNQENLRTYQSYTPAKHFLCLLNELLSLDRKG